MNAMNNGVILGIERVTNNWICAYEGPKRFYQMKIHSSCFEAMMHRIAKHFGYYDIATTMLITDFDEDLYWHEGHDGAVRFVNEDGQLVIYKYLPELDQIFYIAFDTEDCSFYFGLYENEDWRNTLLPLANTWITLAAIFKHMIPHIAAH